jgi:hypothetical protein
MIEQNVQQYNYQPQPLTNSTRCTTRGYVYNTYRLFFWVVCGCVVCGGSGVLAPHPVASFWIPSALFCDAGIRLFVCRRCRFVPPLLLLRREFVMGSSLGMADRPRSRGFRPALCNEGTTEQCLLRVVDGIIGCGACVCVCYHFWRCPPICFGDNYGCEEIEEQQHVGSWFGSHHKDEPLTQSNVQPRQNL